MIDQSFQEQGIGREALDCICDHARGRPGINRLLSSYVPGPDGPGRFYLRYGFVKTGRMRCIAPRVQSREARRARITRMPLKAQLFEEDAVALLGVFKTRLIHVIVCIVIPISCLTAADAKEDL